MAKTLKKTDARFNDFRVGRRMAADPDDPEAAATEEVYVTVGYRLHAGEESFSRDKRIVLTGGMKTSAKNLFNNIEALIRAEEEIE